MEFKTLFEPLRFNWLEPIGVTSNVKRARFEPFLFIQFNAVLCHFITD
jgi:hypothetical protein